MEKKLKLESCRFCNGDGELVRTKDGSNYWFARCKYWNCGARLLARPTMEEAAAFWNRTPVANPASPV